MPPPPEFGDGGGEVRVIKVFFIIKAKDSAKADRHIGITRKIVVNLQGIQDYGQPGGKSPHLAGGNAHDIIDALPEGVGQQHFLCKPVYKTFNSIKLHGNGFVPVCELSGDLMVFYNRSGKNLRE